MPKNGTGPISFTWFIISFLPCESFIEMIKSDWCQFITQSRSGIQLTQIRNVICSYCHDSDWLIVRLVLFSPDGGGRRFTPVQDPAPEYGRLPVHRIQRR